MAESVLYTVIPVVYFTGLMALGFRFNRRNRSRQEYFLARGDLGPATLGFSYSATQMSGSSYMGAVGTERELGYNFAPAGVSSAAAAWFTYVLLGERLRRLASRIRCTTIVDVFEARYRGKGVSMTATLLMLLAFIPLIAAQLKAAGNLFEVLLGEMPALWVVSSFLVWGFFQIGGAPAAVTRFLIPKDRGTLRRALVISIAFSSFIYIGSTLIAIASGVLLPDLEQTDLGRGGAGRHHVDDRFGAAAGEFAGRGEPVRADGAP